MMATKFSMVGTWTVEETTQGPCDWCATRSGKAGIIAVHHYRNTETSQVDSRIRGEGCVQFSFTPPESFLNKEAYLQKVEEEMQDILLGLAIKQWEYLREHGIKAS